MDFFAMGSVSSFVLALCAASRKPKRTLIILPFAIIPKPSWISLGCGSVFDCLSELMDGRKERGEETRTWWRWGAGTCLDAKWSFAGLSVIGWAFSFLLLWFLKAGHSLQCLVGTFALVKDSFPPFAP